jgi:hypothetical protein
MFFEEKYHPPVTLLDISTIFQPFTFHSLRPPNIAAHALDNSPSWAGYLTSTTIASHQESGEAER